jgi:hypothetical protein
MVAAMMDIVVVSSCLCKRKDEEGSSSLLFVERLPLFIPPRPSFVRRHVWRRGEDASSSDGPFLVAHP